MDIEKYTILIVDDEPTNIDVLSGILRDQYKVVAAKNGRKALDRCFSGKIPDLILLDVMMPEIDGYAVCKALKVDPRTKAVPIIFVTAKAQVEDERRGLELGAIDYITKPFSPPIIIQRVKNHLALYNQNRELETKVTERTEELQLSRQEIVTRLGTAAEFKDNETGLHVKRMSRYSYLIAKEMGCDEEWSHQLLIASPMHDVGKIGIPDAVLLKPGKLDPEEWEIMKSHCHVGARILEDSDSKLLKFSAIIAKTHHEKWNGNGYPQGLTKSEIPLEGRIVAVADVFDALTSVRPYKKAWDVEKTVNHIKEESGEHFDPNVVAAFVSVLPEILDVKDSFKDSL
jgi:putative two-component system response regulator